MSDASDVKEFIRSLYDAFASDIYRYARLTIGDADRAKDVVQETFLRAFRSSNQYRKEANPKTWLMSIARNYMYDLLRRKKTERRYLSNQIQIDQTDNKLSSVEMMLVLEDALSQIKEAYRQVFILRHVHEFSVRETAQILKWSISKVKTTDSRAVSKLNHILGDIIWEVSGEQ